MPEGTPIDAGVTGVDYDALMVVPYNCTVAYISHDLAGLSVGDVGWIDDAVLVWKDVRTCGTLRI